MFLGSGRRPVRESPRLEGQGWWSYVELRRSEDQEILDAVERLRPEDQEILRLAVWEELPRRQIAEMIGTSAHAITQRIYRITRQLAGEVERLRLRHPDAPVIRNTCSSIAPIAHRTMDYQPVDYPSRPRYQDRRRGNLTVPTLDRVVPPTSSPMSTTREWFFSVPTLGDTMRWLGHRSLESR